MHYIDIQHASKESSPVSDETLKHWVQLALDDEGIEVTIRLVDPEEMNYLNHTYRKIDKATNVLAFPSDHPDNIELDYHFLGDVILCPAVLKLESETLNTPLIDHWAHIVIHGILHLLGYDHIKEDDALVMQGIETKLLAQLNIKNPYN